jgi:hypothetical protein
MKKFLSIALSIMIAASSSYGVTYADNGRGKSGNFEVNSKKSPANNKNEKKREYIKDSYPSNY